MEWRLYMWDIYIIDINFKFKGSIFGDFVRFFKVDVIGGFFYGEDVFFIISRDGVFKLVVRFSFI